MGEVTACGICRGKELSTVLDLGQQPLAERFDTDIRYPLRLVECANCGLVQLSYIVDATELFPPDHPYTTATSPAQSWHFTLLADDLAPLLLHPADVVVDIGANDGTLLSKYPANQAVVAVEPTNQARKCREAGMATYQEFFTSDLARRIRSMHGPAKVVTACNVLAHVPDPHDFMIGVTALLADDGVFVTESHDFASISGGLQIDTIYHEHLRYYSVASLSRLLDLHGLDVVSSERIPTYGGSFQVRATKRQGNLAARAADAAEVLYSMLHEIAGEGGTVYGVGAATRAVPLLHYAALAPYISRVCEVSASEKIGKMMPGTQIPIVDEIALIEDQPDYALLFAYHLAGDIIPKLKKMGYTGQFIIPLPDPYIRVT